jgi:hypothetical protein
MRYLKPKGKFTHRVFLVLIGLSVMILAAESANASEVQIATLNITTTVTSLGYYSETVYFSNLTSTTLIFNQEQLYIGPNVYFLPVTGSIAPYSTLNVFGCQGGCQNITYSIAGQFASLDFNIGAQSYQDYGLIWISPKIPGVYNGSVPIYLPTPTPEPASMALFGTGMLTIIFTIRKRLIA